MTSRITTVADKMLSQLALWGCKNMYGVAGDAIIPLLNAIEQQDALHYFAVRHETAAAFMASTEGKCTTRVGICTGTSGPGLANMLNGIADASADHIPMLVITGQVTSDKIGTEAKQYVDQQKLIDPLTVFSASLHHPDNTVTLVNKAIIEAISKRGVSHISVPKDVFALPCNMELQTPTGILKSTFPVNGSQLDSCAKTIQSAQKPILYIGKGARNASVQVLAFAEKIKAGIIETLGAKGTIPANHALNLGGIGEGGTVEGSELLKQTDCLILVGANWYPKNYVPKNTQIIKIDLSPSSIEAQQGITFGLVGDAADMLTILNQKVTGRSQSDWFDQVKMTKANIIKRLDSERELSDQTISPQALMAALENSVASDAIITLDTGDHTIWFNRIFRAKQQSILFSGKWRTMGYSLPAAISAKLQYPNKQVTALAGDGSFMMTVMELSTLVKYKTPIKIIVANNTSLAAEKTKMLKEGLEPYGVELTNPDFALLASAFGIKSMKVTQPDELQNALQEIYSDEQPALLEVQISSLPTSDANIKNPKFEFIDELEITTTV